MKMKQMKMKQMKMKPVWEFSPLQQIMTVVAIMAVVVLGLVFVPNALLALFLTTVFGWVVWIVVFKFIPAIFYDVYR